MNALARTLCHAARAELARLHRIRGAGRRTARRRAEAGALAALGAALAAAPLAAPARAVVPVFLNPFLPYGLGRSQSYSATTFADIDGDGDLDAFVGQGDGNTLFFANSGTATAAAFAGSAVGVFGLADVGDRSAPEFADLDGDGDLDALVGGQNGDLSFFRNTGTSVAPAFAAPSTNPFGLSNVALRTAPALVDVDADGDLDAFVGEDEGNTLFFLNSGTAGVPAFAAPSTNPFGLTNVGERSAPAFADLDGDGDLDALLGESGGATLFFRNTGSETAPAFAPATPNAFGLKITGPGASPAFADLDGDGDLDVVTGLDAGYSILFENWGSAGAPAFASPQEPFGLAIVGTYSHPTFADLDGDGDLDVLVGNDQGSVLFFSNSGAATAPAFAPPTTDPFGLVDETIRSTPAFADIDADGDLDGFIGGNGGIIRFYSNSGTATVPAFAAPVTNLSGLMDVGAYSSIALADIDGDGDLDAFLGERDGALLFFQNVGNAAAPAFAVPVPNPFGLDDVGLYSQPAFADLDGDGDLDGFVGEVFGDTIFFENTGTATAAAFADPATNPFGFARVFYHAAPAFGDLDGDGDLDALVGDIPGHTNFFHNLSSVCSPAPDPACATGFAKSSLLVNEKKAGKEKLVAKLGKGPALDQADFGDPTAPNGTAVALCVYDDTGARRAALEIRRAGEACGAKPCWKPVGKPPPDGKGFAYKDKAAGAGGIKSVALKGGAAGKSSLAAAAGNSVQRGQAALPTGIAAALLEATSVTLQVHTSDAECFSATLGEIVEQENALFKAK